MERNHNMIAAVAITITALALTGCGTTGKCISVFGGKKTPAATAGAKQGTNAPPVKLPTTNAPSATAVTNTVQQPVPALAPSQAAPAANVTSGGPCLLINPGEEVTLFLTPSQINPPDSYGTFTFEMAKDASEVHDIPAGQWECIVMSRTNPAISRFTLVVDRQPVNIYNGPGKSGAYHAIKNIKD